MKNIHLDEIKDNTFQCKAADVQARLPIDFPIQLSATMPWSVDYKNRKHVFLWLPSSQTLSFEDYGTGVVQAQIWVNLGMPNGLKVYAPSVPSASPIYAMIRCTDEIIP